MPGMDGTGPLGTGPIDRGQGPCGQGRNQSFYRYGRGFGFGRGFGRGFRGGFGCGLGWRIPFTEMPIANEEMSLENETN